MRLTTPKETKDLKSSLARFRCEDRDKEAVPAKRPSAAPDDIDTRLQDLKAKLTSKLIEDFKLMAPGHAVHAYNAYVQSTAFEQRLLRELHNQEACFADLPNETACLDWLLLLVHRKEVDLGGMVANARVPNGYQRGRGSMQGNNCWISSVMQCLRGCSEQGPSHLAECAKIRTAGIDALWGPRNFVEANHMNLAFVADHVLGPGHTVVCDLFSGHDGRMRGQIRSGCGRNDDPTTHIIHVFNPTGVHFDPLWTEEVV